jgi:hypothetical protein
MTPTRSLNPQAANKREPIIDAQLDKDLATLPAADTSAAMDAQRFALYVQATQRATARHALMPDLPDVINNAINRTTGARGTQSDAHRTLSIPAEVVAAHSRRLIVEAVEGGASHAEIAMTAMLGRFAIDFSR